MVTIRCFWALIKFMAVYLLAFVIAHLLARDMLVVSYIRPRFVFSKIFSCNFPFSLLAICFSSVWVLLLSWFSATRTSSRDLVKGFSELVGNSNSAWTLFWFVARFLSLFFLSFFFLFFWEGSCLVIGLVSNLHPSGRNLVTWPFLVFVTYTLLGILSFFWLRQ